MCILETMIGQNPRLFKYLQSRGVFTIVGIANNHEEVVSALDLKPDALMTDRPTLLRDYFESLNMNGKGGWTLPKNL